MKRPEITVRLKLCETNRERCFLFLLHFQSVTLFERFSYRAMKTQQHKHQTKEKKDSFFFFFTVLQRCHDEIGVWRQLTIHAGFKCNGI